MFFESDLSDFSRFHVEFHENLSSAMVTFLFDLIFYGVSPRCEYSLAELRRFRAQPLTFAESRICVFQVFRELNAAHRVIIGRFIDADSAIHRFLVRVGGRHRENFALDSSDLQLWFRMGDTGCLDWRFPDQHSSSDLEFFDFLRPLIFSLFSTSNSKSYDFLRPSFPALG
jgi:hypothetical protein